MPMSILVQSSGYNVQSLIMQVQVRNIIQLTATLWPNILTAKSTLGARGLNAKSTLNDRLVAKSSSIVIPFGCFAFVSKLELP